MKKYVAVLLAAVLALSLCACSPKSFIQDKTREILGLEGGDSSSGSSKPSSWLSFGNNNAASGSNSGSEEPKPTTPKPDADDYWGLMRWEAENAPEEGYVWTITVDEEKVLDVLGLAQVNYSFKMSCSHVGPDRYGVYRGEMEMAYNADMDVLGQLLTVTGGSMDYDGDGWCKNDSFLMRLEPYDKENDEEWVAAYATLPMGDDPMVQMIMSQIFGTMLTDIGSSEEAFETENDPAGHWFDWDFRLTEGDLSAFMALTGIAYGTTSASSYVDSSGKNVEAEGEAYLPLAGYFHERYSEEIENPIPYSVEVYEEDQVVVSFYSADGSPIVLKFYGTIDKKPVEETLLMKP